MKKVSSKYKKVYDYLDNYENVTYGYIGNYRGFLRLSIYRNEFQWNISDFTIDGLLEQIKEIFGEIKK